jgi:hypothetical protein
MVGRMAVGWGGGKWGAEVSVKIENLFSHEGVPI